MIDARSFAITAIVAAAVSVSACSSGSSNSPRGGAGGAAGGSLGGALSSGGGSSSATGRSGGTTTVAGGASTGSGGSSPYFGGAGGARGGSVGSGGEASGGSSAATSSGGTASSGGTTGSGTTGSESGGAAGSNATGGGKDAGGASGSSGGADGGNGGANSGADGHSADTASSCTAGTTQIGYTCQFAWSATMAPYILYNNWWGASGATGQQCIWGTCQDGDVIGWTTNWSWSGGTGSVLTYSSVVFGWHYGWPVPNTGLPIPVASSNAVNCSWDFTLAQASGSFDVTYDIWLHPTANAPTESPPYTDGGQSDEVMIWLNQAGNPGPAGPEVASAISIAGSTWNLFEGSSGSWAIHSYVRTSNTTTAAFDIMSFLKDLVTRNLMPNTRYLTGVEAGIEVRTGTGSGTLTTNTFSCEIQ
ncbi:MAG: hypothetical protein ABSB49_04675 [Polyangia bacterium]